MRTGTAYRFQYKVGWCLLFLVHCEICVSPNYIMIQSDVFARWCHEYRYFEASDLPDRMTSFCFFASLVSKRTALSGTHAILQLLESSKIDGFHHMKSKNI